MTKILYAGLRYGFSYPDGQRDPSFAHVNIYLPLISLPETEVNYYFLERVDEIGGRDASLEIKDLVNKLNPELIFIGGLNHDLNKNVFQEIRREKKTKIAAAFFDEDTDLYQRSLAWAPYLDWLITFYTIAYEEYRKRGFNVIGTNWFINDEFYKSGFKIQDSRFKNIDVSFVGAAKPERITIIKQLGKHGINVETWGSGWPNGPVGFDKMIEIFNSSKINLNLGQAKSIWRWQTLFRIFFSPAKNRFGFKSNFFNAIGNLKTILNRKRPQSRARLFEIVACGQFILTNKASLFGKYTDGEDIVYFEDFDDLVYKIKKYLNDDQKRQFIIENSSARFAQENSARDQIKNILEKIMNSQHA